MLAVGIIFLSGKIDSQVFDEKVHKSDLIEDTNDNIQEAEEDISDTEIAKAKPYRVNHETLVLHEILEGGGFLNQMQSWNGKMLVVKFESASVSPVFKYHEYLTHYQDSNNNNILDEQDQGFFNPASTVKVAIAALALEKLNALGVERDTEYRIVNESNWYRIDEDIRLSIVISDNDAANRLILWLGFDYIKSTLANKGLDNLAVERLMLDRGTLVDSPAFEMRFNNQKKYQQPKSVSIKPSCYEKDERVGNCATASNLVEALIRIVQPEYFSNDERFRMTQSDRMWLQEIMMHTPREEGFELPDNYCRFLTEVERRFSSQSGRMLSKCGVALFSNTYVDTSLIETDDGHKYYVAFAVSPTRRLDEETILQWMNTTANFVLSKLP